MNEDFIRLPKPKQPEPSAADQILFLVKMANGRLKQGQKIVCLTEGGLCVHEVTIFSETFVILAGTLQGHKATRIVNCANLYLDFIIVEPGDEDARARHEIGYHQIPGFPAGADK